MKAIVLCAGLGSRFRPATEGRPKALLKFLNVPLLVRRLHALARFGIPEAAVNLHHEGLQIVEELAREPVAGVRVRFFREPEILGTAGALKNAEAFLEDGDFLVWNVDAELDPDLASLVRLHRDSGAAITLLVAANRDPARFTPLAVDRERVTGWGGHVADPFLFTGVSIVAPRVLPRLKGGFRSVVEDLWRPLIESGERIAAAIHTGSFFDLGAPGDFLAASLHALETRRDFSPEEGIFDIERQILTLTPLGGVVAGRSVVGKARIAAGAILEECVIWDGAAIGAGARLRGAVVGPAAVASGEFSGVLLWPGSRGQVNTFSLQGSHCRPPAVK